MECLKKNFFNCFNDFNTNYKGWFTHENMLHPCMGRKNSNFVWKHGADVSVSESNIIWNSSFSERIFVCLIHKLNCKIFILYLKKTATYVVKLYLETVNSRYGAFNFFFIFRFRYIEIFVFVSLLFIWLSYFHLCPPLQADGTLLSSVFYCSDVAIAM